MNIYYLVIIITAIFCGSLMLWKIPFIKRASDDHKIDDNRKVSLVIPAYNEEKRLPALLDSLSRQDYLPHQIIVVDDHSEDNTAKVAGRYGVDVVRSLPLYKGWIGKSRACWSGALSATGDWLMFLDADVSFEHKDSLRSLLNQYHELGADGIFSVQPYHKVKKAYESLSAIFNIIVLAGMSVFTPMGKRIKGAGAFGPCILCNKSQYFQTGGHKAISRSVMDDLELGRAFEREGLPVHCYGGRGIVRFRMYPDGLGSLFEGWTKNFGSASQSTHRGVFAMIIIWITGGFSLMILLTRLISSGDTGLLMITALLYLIYSLQMIWHARRAGNFFLPVLIFFPLLLVFFTVLFIWSLIRTKIFRSVSWRGRKIDV